jgi:hypothetical protein
MTEPTLSVSSKARMATAEALFRYAPWLLPLRRMGGYHGTKKLPHYFDVYTDYLHGWRHRSFSMLELGVYRGESLRMWRNYFPRATIYGLDIDPDSARRADGFKVFTGSQTDPEFLGHVLDEIGPDLRVVIDDASHVTAFTMASFEAIFPRLASGSIYFIEDLGLTYDDQGWNEHEWHNRELNPEIPDVGRDGFDRFVTGLVHEVDAAGLGRPSSVAFVESRPLMLLVGKA